MIRRVFLHLYMMRIPLVMLFVVVIVLPSIFTSRYFHGLADLKLNQVWIVSFGAFLLVSSAMTCTFLVILYGTDRADGPIPATVVSDAETAPSRKLPASGWVIGAMYLVGLGAYLRFLRGVLHVTKGTHLDPAVLQGHLWYRALLGAVAGSLAVVVVFALDLWLSSPREAPEVEVFAFPIAYLFRDFEVVQRMLRRISDSEPARLVTSRLEKLSGYFARVLGPGYRSIDAKDKTIKLAPGHGFAAILAIVCLGVYLATGFGGHSRLYTDLPFGTFAPYEAVLFQFLLLFLVACWTFAGISFYFDRFRVPVLLPFALVLFFTSNYGSSDHAYHTLTRDTSGVVLPTPEARFAATSDHVIVVAAAGEGIQAAA
jgi:hypothetical protein